jgi:carbonic anhydrase
MKQINLSRRAMLGLGGFALLGSYPSYAKSFDQQQERYPTNSDEALQRLLEGNRRFSEGKTTHPNRDAERRAELHNKQQPFATILACSDSRVPPELLFDQGFGVSLSFAWPAMSSVPKRSAASSIRSLT